MLMDNSTVLDFNKVIVNYSLIGLILIVIANWKIFKKAGEAGWKCLIPFYNMYTEYEFTWDGWIAFVSIAFTILFAVNWFRPDDIIVGILTPMEFAVIVLDIIQSIRLAKAFGKGVGFGIGLILLEPIFRMILGFGSAQYVGKVDDSKLC